MFEYKFRLSFYNENGSYTTYSLGEDDYLENYQNANKPYIAFSEIHARLQGELNSAYMEVLTSNSQTFPIFALISIDIIENENVEHRHYYVGRDSVEISNKDGSKYLHKVELIDLTKKLEKHILETITFKQPTNVNERHYTIWDCLQRIWRIYKTTTISTPTAQDIIRYVYNNIDIENLPYNINTLEIIDFIDEDLKPILSKIQAPELVLSNLTLREAFDEVLKYVNAITIIKYDIENNWFILSCEFYNKTKEVIDYANKIENLQDDHNVEDYGSELHNFVKNQITENYSEESAVYYPSKESFTYPLTQETNYEIDDSNFGALLPHNIFSILEFIIPCNIKFYKDGLPEEERYNFKVNIADYIVEEEQYNSLVDDPTKLTFDLTKNNTIYYKYGSNFINMSQTHKGFLFQKHSVTYSVGLCSALQFVRYLISQGYTFETGSLVTYLIEAYWVDNDDDIPLGRVSFHIDDDNNIVLEDVDYSSIEANDLTYNIKYIPQYNARLVSQKSDTTTIKVDTQSLSNQRAKIISLQNIALNDKSNLERTGNETIQIALRHKSLNDLYHSGDFTNNGYIITKCEYIYYDTYILGKYELTKNYSKLSEYIGINSEYRAFEIPSGSSVYERNMTYSNYIYVAPNSYNIVSSTYTPKLTQLGFMNCLKTLYNGSTNSTINNVICDIDYGMLKDTYDEIYNGSGNKNNLRLLLSSTSDGGGDNLIFHFSFADNISSGYTHTTNDGKIFMRKVPYTYNGRFLTMGLQYISGDNSLPTNQVPLTNIEGQTINPLINLSDLYVMKDSAEIIDFTFQLSFINKAPFDIMLGKDFTNKNNLVYEDENEDYTYFIYGSNTPFDRSEKFIQESKVSVLFELNSTNTILTQNGNTIVLTIPSVANYNYDYFYIGDILNNTYILATKKEHLVNGIKFVLSDKRTDIKERY